MDSKRCKLLNCYIDSITMNQLLHDFNEGVLITPNVDHMMTLQEDHDFYMIYQTAEYVVLDSQVIAFIMKFFLRTPVPEKISGSDFFPAFYQYHKDNPDIKIFLLGGKPGAPEKAMELINAKIGRAIVIGAHSPSMGFEKNDKECAKIVEMINKSGATVLAVGVGSPKQEKWIFTHKDKLRKIKIFMGIGATIEFEAGYVQRAPAWISRAGMEWLYRLLQEPGRLWRRYLIRDLPFFWLVFKQKLGLYKDPLKRIKNPGMQNVFIEGIKFNNITKQEFKFYIDKLAENSKKNHLIVTPNVDFLVRANNDSEFKKMINSSDFSVCDSAVIYNSSKLLKGNRLRDKITGYDAMTALLEISNKRKDKIYLLGSTDDTVKLAAKNIQKMYPDITVAGLSNGFFNIEKDSAIIIKKINDSGAKYLFVGMGSPRQEQWVHSNKRKIKSSFIICIGGLFDIFSGKIKRAPVFLQKIGLEWFWRFLNDPRRLFKRYFVYDMRFFYLLLKQIINK